MAEKQLTEEQFSKELQALYDKIQSEMAKPQNKFNRVLELRSAYRMSRSLIHFEKLEDKFAQLRYIDACLDNRSVYRPSAES